MRASLPPFVGKINSLSTSQCPFQVFPGTLLPCPYEDPQNPDHLLARSEVERRNEYIQLLHRQLLEQHPLVQLVHQCLRNTPARRPSAEELLQQLEVVRAQIEGGPYGQLVKVDMEKLRMVRTLREKDTEIGQLQQQMQQLEVSSVWGATVALSASGSQRGGAEDEVRAHWYAGTTVQNTQKLYLEDIYRIHPKLPCISVIYVHLKYMGRQLAMPKVNYLPLYTACIGTTPIQYRQDEY